MGEYKPRYFSVRILIKYEITSKMYRKEDFRETVHCKRFPYTNFLSDQITQIRIVGTPLNFYRFKSSVIKINITN